MLLSPYLAPDSFTYFDLVKQFWEHGVLYSYTGLEHTIGIHPGWYFLLLPLYPLAGSGLPWRSLVGATAIYRLLDCRIITL